MRPPSAAGVSARHGCGSNVIPLPSVPSAGRAGLARATVGKIGRIGMEEKAAPPDRFETRPFRPAAWLPSPHGQTIGGRVFRRAAPMSFRRERIDTPDGDFLDLDFPQNSLTSGPVVL